MAVFNHLRKCCFFIPIKTGVYLITIFGLLNKLSGFYGMISLDYSDPIVVCIYVYSLLALSVFGLGLYGIHLNKYKFIRLYAFFYAFDFIISTITTVYLAIQWFIYTDHSLPDLENKPELKKEHDDSFRMESIVSIVLLSIMRVVHLYFVYVVACYYVSVNKTQYSKLTASVDEELNFSGYDELEEDEEMADIAPLNGRRR